MAGTRTGGLQAAATNKALHGPDFYKRIGAKGGSVKGTKGGFASMTPEERSHWGTVGGAISRRGKATKDDKIEDTWKNPNYRNLDSTGNSRTRRHRCASCKELFKVEHLDDQGLCMGCPQDLPLTERLKKLLSSRIPF